MSETMLLWPIILPAVAGLLVLALRKAGILREAVATGAMLANLVLAALLWGKELNFSAPWAGFGLEFTLRVYGFSSFILISAAGFAFLVTMYCWKFMKDRANATQFYAYMLISVAMVNGAVLADHLVVLLFFWEGLLVTLFGMIAIGRPGAWKSATKAFVLVGVSDLCMMIGIALTGWLGVASGADIAKALTMSELGKSALPLTGLGSVAMIFMMIGAISKAGSMPFHSWIPDAALDAPLPFMAFLPASLEKLLGIYFLSRIALDLFNLTTNHWVSLMLMIIGSLVILLAVMMALVQKDYKRLLSYHAISQVGYMILGIGTALPIGVVGGIFHMINHAMYKSCLFLTGGSVEKQAGTTDLAKLGGLMGKMPITFACFVIAAASISGFPLTNGFYSKELVYDAALERNVVFYLAAILGTFFTAASFLKLGHAAYLGRRRAEHADIKEAPASMLLPMVVIAGMCLVFGLGNALPIDHIIKPAMEHSYFGQSYLQVHHEFEGHFAGWPSSTLLVVVTAVVLAMALANHMFGARVGGSGLHAADHIHHAPVLATIYDKAAKQWFDPYELFLSLMGILAQGGYWIDRGVDYVVASLTVSGTGLLTRGVRLAHTGSYSLYIVWALGGAGAVVVWLLMAF